jgi:sulfate transport system permease protein
VTVSSIAAATTAEEQHGTHWFFLQPPVFPGFRTSFILSLLYVGVVICSRSPPVRVRERDDVAGLLAGDHRRTRGRELLGDDQRRVLCNDRRRADRLLFAWNIERYDFPGRRLLDALIDLPFALPTAVAGLTLSVLLVPGGWLGQFLAPLGIKVAYAYPGLVVAMTFTSLPFVVRLVQPVLQDFPVESEEAAKTLGASRVLVFWKVILPALVPALVAGASQAFVRNLGEFGAVIMISGNIPFRTEVTSLMIFVRMQEYNYPAAAAIASVMLVVSLLLLWGLQLLQARVLRWQRR